MSYMDDLSRRERRLERQAAREIKEANGLVCGSLALLFLPVLLIVRLSLGLIFLIFKLLFWILKLPFKGLKG